MWTICTREKPYFFIVAQKIYSPDSQLSEIYKYQIGDLITLHFWNIALFLVSATYLWQKDAVCWTICQDWCCGCKYYQTCGKSIYIWQGQNSNVERWIFLSNVWSNLFLLKYTWLRINLLTRLDICFNYNCRMLQYQLLDPFRVYLTTTGSGVGPIGSVTRSF